MDALRTALVSLTQSVWGTLLAAGIEPVEPIDDGHDTSSLMAPFAGDDVVVATVDISGGWVGVVAVIASAALADEIATLVLGIDASEVTSDDVADVIGEVANMIGGNAKALLSGDASLSLPVVTRGDLTPAGVPPGEQAAVVDFLTCRRLLRVVVMSGERQGVSS